jgi:hypothetical protein
MATSSGHAEAPNSLLQLPAGSSSLIGYSRRSCHLHLPVRGYSVAARLSCLARHGEGGSEGGDELLHLDQVRGRRRVVVAGYGGEGGDDLYRSISERLTLRDLLILGYGRHRSKVVDG